MLELTLQRHDLEYLLVLLWFSTSTLPSSSRLKCQISQLLGRMNPGAISTYVTSCSSCSYISFRCMSCWWLIQHQIHPCLYSSLTLLILATPPGSNKYPTKVTQSLWERWWEYWGWGKLNSCGPFCAFTQFNPVLLWWLVVQELFGTLLHCDCRMHSKVLRNHQARGSCDA